jgi:RNA processing factor Prp31
MQRQTHDDHAKQLANSISTMKLLDGQYTKTGRETLKELFRVHFPEPRKSDFTEARAYRSIGLSTNK